MLDEQQIEPNVRLDFKGQHCPGPIIGAKRMIDSLADGQVLLLISDCPGTKDDLYVWAENTGNRVLRTEKFADGSVGYYVQRGGRRAREASVSLDMRGAVCPGPILEAKKLLNGMKSGEILRLTSNCPGTRDDIEDWAKATGLELLEVIQLSVTEFDFFIRKP